MSISVLSDSEIFEIISIAEVQLHIQNVVDQSSHSDFIQVLLVVL
ncbi:hypothetical protein ES707_21687 [subsurface metagenome]